jgi:erythromycin esterase-like protein
LNAANVLILRDLVSPAHRIITWAHHSHVHHNSLGANVPSMGQHLLTAIPKELYTIGLFAGGGTALDIDDSALVPAAPRAIRRSGDGVEGLLARYAPGDYFVDLSEAALIDPRWSAPDQMRFEGGYQVATLLAKDFHAAVFIRHVHAAELTFLSPAVRAGLRLYGGLRDHLVWVEAGLAAVLIALAVFVRRWWARWRSRGIAAGQDERG